MRGIERGENNLTLLSLVKICKHLKISVNSLLQNTGIYTLSVTCLNTST